MRDKFVFAAATPVVPPPMLLLPTPLVLAPSFSGVFTPATPAGMMPAMSMQLPCDAEIDGNGAILTRGLWPSLLAAAAPRAGGSAGTGAGSGVVAEAICIGMMFPSKRMYMGGSAVECCAGLMAIRCATVGMFFSTTAGMFSSIFGRFC